MTYQGRIVLLQNLHSLSLDWKAKVEDLQWRLTDNVLKNYGITPVFRRPIEYGQRAAITYDNVLPEHDSVLKMSGLQIGLINNKSD